MITDQQLTDLCNTIQTMLHAYYNEHYPNIMKPTITFERGSNYARIVKHDSQRCVFCFIALKDVKTKNMQAKEGDILKAASWKAPAKHARGTILDGSPLKYIGPYGPAYLK